MYQFQKTSKLPSISKQYNFHFFLRLAAHNPRLIKAFCFQVNMNINSSLRSIAIDAIMKSCEEENFKRDLLDKFPVNKPRELAKKHPESDFSRFYGMAASLPIGDPERASRFNATSKALTHVRTELELELVRKQWKGETINGRPFDELSVLSLDDSSTSGDSICCQDLK